MLFRFDPMVYPALLMFAAISWFLDRTKAGLVLRTIGESPQTSHAIGSEVASARRRRFLSSSATFENRLCAKAGSSHRPISLWNCGSAPRHLTPSC
jgi:ABC-type uncharacterized transport system permease subunit